MKAVSRKGLGGLGGLGAFLTLIGLACATVGLDTGSMDEAALVEEKCTVCHSITNITQTRKTPTEWSRTVKRMRNKSPETISPEEGARIADYLSRTYGKP